MFCNQPSTACEFHLWTTPMHPTFLYTYVKCFWLIMLRMYCIVCCWENKFSFISLFFLLLYSPCLFLDRPAEKYCTELATLGRWLSTCKQSQLAQGRKPLTSCFKLIKNIDFNADKHILFYTSFYTFWADIFISYIRFRSYKLHMKVENSQNLYKYRETIWLLYPL